MTQASFPIIISAFIHRCKKARHFFLKLLIILLLISPHGHVTSKIKQESTTVLNEGSRLVTDPEFTKSSLLPEEIQNRQPHRIHVHQDLSLQFLFLLTPVRLKDASIVLTQSLKLPEKATGIYGINESQLNSTKKSIRNLPPILFQESLFHK